MNNQKNEKRCKNSLKILQAVGQENIILNRLQYFNCVFASLLVLLVFYAIFSVVYAYYKIHHYFLQAITHAIQPLAQRPLNSKERSIRVLTVSHQRNPKSAFKYSLSSKTTLQQRSAELCLSVTSMYIK